jgi:hypothetical protein
MPDNLLNPEMNGHASINTALAILDLRPPRPSRLGRLIAICSGREYFNSTRSLVRQICGVQRSID